MCVYYAAHVGPRKTAAPGYLNEICHVHRRNRGCSLVVEEKERKRRYAKRKTRRGPWVNSENLRDVRMYTRATLPGREWRGRIYSRRRARDSADPIIYSFIFDDVTEKRVSMVGYRADTTLYEV